MSERGPSSSKHQMATSPARAMRRRGLTRSAWAGLAAILVVGIVGVASGANLPAATAIVKAPYGGFGLGIARSYNFLCQAGTTILKFPEFNTTTGIALTGGNATAKPCPFPPGTNTLSEQELLIGAAFDSANITGLAGAVHFETHWKLSFKGNLHVALGGKGQFAEAVAQVEVSGDLENVSSQTDYDFTESTLSAEVNTSTGTNLPFKESKLALTQYLNETLSAKYTYELLTYVEIFLASEVSLPGSSVAYSEIQMYGGSEGATLTSYSD